MHVSWVRIVPFFIDKETPYKKSDPTELIANFLLPGDRHSIFPADVHAN